MEGIGSGAVSAPFNAAMDAECIVGIGARPTVNHPVAATFFKQAAKRGAKLIVIDPRGQDLMRHATHSLRFKSGSDVALLNSLLHTIIAEELRGGDIQDTCPASGAQGEGEGLLARSDGRGRGIDAGRAAAWRASMPPKASIFFGAWASRSTRTAPTMRAA